eukprot:3105430-Prymnesium_polylepis.1
MTSVGRCALESNSIDLAPSHRLDGKMQRERDDGHEQSHEDTALLGVLANEQHPSGCFCRTGIPPSVSGFRAGVESDSRGLKSLQHTKCQSATQLERLVPIRVGLICEQETDRETSALQM